MATIKQTYHDALFFASASINKNTDFYLTSSDYKVLSKLIHQSTLYPKVTIQNDTIAKYIWLAETTVRDSIKSLIKMNYIQTEGQVFNNRGGFKSIRTISINWDRLSTILTKSNPVETQEEQITPTLEEKPEIEQEDPMTKTTKETLQQIYHNWKEEAKPTPYELFQYMGSTGKIKEYEKHWEFISSPIKSNTVDLSEENKEVIVDVIEDEIEEENNTDTIKLECTIVEDFNLKDFKLAPPTQEQIEAIKDFHITEKTVLPTQEQNYIQDILNLIDINQDKVGLLGQSDTIKLTQIIESGTAKKFDVTVFKNILGKL